MNMKIDPLTIWYIILAISFIILFFAFYGLIYMR